MTKNIILGLFAFLIAIVSFSTSCNENTANKEPIKTDSTKTAECTNDSINPNGSSELALLMRKMFDEGMIVKQNIIDGKEIGSYPTEYEKIKTATPTEADMKQENFDAFADDMLNALKKLHQVPPALRKENFNRFVSTCLSCHNLMCPGPKRKIVKLTIQ